MLQNHITNNTKVSNALMSTTLHDINPMHVFPLGKRTPKMLTTGGMVRVMRANHS